MKRPAFLTSVVGYTRFVLFGRSFLWFMIAVLIIGMIYMANSDSEESGGRLVFSNIKKMTDDMQNVMSKPHYQGLDEENMPYSVIADSATQIDDDTVQLDNIQADLATKDGSWIAVHSGSGIIKIESKYLTLSDKVDMFYDGGYEFRTSTADIDIKNGMAKGSQPVEGQGPMGTLNANNFEVTERGKVIRFNGSVRVVLYRD